MKTAWYDREPRRCKTPISLAQRLARFCVRNREHLDNAALGVLTIAGVGFLGTIIKLIG